MCGLALNNQPVRRQQLARHHPKTSKALRENVALHVSIVVLGRPYESTRRFDGLCDHVVDQSMLVIDVEGLELRLVLAIQDQEGQKIAHIVRKKGEALPVVDLLENVLESPIVFLQDGVLGRHKLRKVGKV